MNLSYFLNGRFPAPEQNDQMTMRCFLANDVKTAADYCQQSDVLLVSLHPL